MLSWRCHFFVQKAAKQHIIQQGDAKIDSGSINTVHSFIAGEKIYLRPIAIDDANFIYQGENDELVRDALFLALPVSLSAAREKIEKSINDPSQIVFMIVTKDRHITVGQTAFFRIDYISRAAVFYLAILDAKFWGSGFGAETTKLMVDYAFQTLNLNRIQLHVNEKNTPAIKIYQRVGFQKEGVLRQAMFKNNRYFDFWVMGILREEWEKILKR
ncbi:MAG: GNAT family N-acetyltransferase [Calditrichaeota bacterium]|nr:GNAT family N-acetyltransferase [Calditrichota bacterium]